MQSINLNMIPGGVMPVINLTQFDEGRDFALVILNGAQAADLTGATLLISGKKNDDTSFSYGQSDTVKGNYVISVNNNTVTIRNTLQMAAASGEVIATLTIKKSAADVSTLNFRIMVQEHPLDGVDISNTEIPAIIALAQEQADEAEAWATGEIDGTPVPPTAPQYENSAEYWAGQAQQAAQGGLHFTGSCTFAQIPTTGMEVGDMWDITDDFTTDNRFREGAGVQCKAGTNIAWDGTYWDVLATGSPLALPTGGIAGQFIVKQSSTDQDADWGSGIYHFANEAAAQAALSGGTIPNGATVLVDEIGGGTLQAPAISNLADVIITTIADGQMLVYDNTSGKWKNKNIDSAISTTSSNAVKNSVIAAALANGRITFAIDANGKAGYKLDGADTVYPFKDGSCSRSQKSKSSSSWASEPVGDVVFIANIGTALANKINSGTFIEFRLGGNHMAPGLFAIYCSSSSPNTVQYTLPTVPGSGDYTGTAIYCGYSVPGTAPTSYGSIGYVKNIQVDKPNGTISVTFYKASSSALLAYSYAPEIFIYNPYDTGDFNVAVS